jgi:HTH-type transcriptional regulator / antitoxin HipB
MKFTLTTPEETALELAERVKALRLSKKWKRATLADKSGVSCASLQRFEQTGQVSMKHFLRIVFALGRLDEMRGLLQNEPARSIADLEQREQHLPRRGTV